MTPVHVLIKIVTIFLPFIAAFVSYCIQQNHWSKTINILIAGLTILLATLASIVMEGNVTGNIYTDSGIVFAASTALQSETLAPLMAFLRTNLPVPPATPPHDAVTVPTAMQPVPPPLITLP